MKVSINWAQQYSNADFKKLGKDKLIDSISSQLGAIDEVVNYIERYAGIVVVKIIKCYPHPEADKLKICWVDDGQVVPDVERDEKGLVQIVCGGPNAKEEMFTAWIPPGRIIPSSWDNNRAALEAKEIRGQISHGMLASPAELGISSEHGGIIDINPSDIGREPKIGEPLAGLYGLDDLVIDIENKMFTHRPDCFGILGVAREIAGINHMAFKSPDWYISLPADAFKQTAFAELPFKAENKLPELVPRFTAIALSDIKIGPSPYWMQAGLSRVGVKPINNVVDTLNFVTYLTGQPMHAFDYDKVQSGDSAGLEVRKAAAGESLTVLGGKTLKLNDEDIVIAKPAGRVLALAGIIGGADTEVSAYTKNIIIECATFDMYAVRKSSMRHGLFTDASVRYTKGQSPLQNPPALSYCIELLKQLAGAQIASELTDINHVKKHDTTIKTNVDFINSRLGTKLSADEIDSLLKNVELGVSTRNGELVVSAPFWRQDLKIQEDIVEEVGRLYGYDKLPNELPMRNLNPPTQNQLFDFKRNLREVLSKYGLDEFLTYSFVSSKLLTAAGQDIDKTYKVKNALSPDLEAYRLSLVPSLLEKVHSNSKLGYRKLSYFEIGQTCIKDELDTENVPVQHQLLGVIISQQGVQPSYFAAKQTLEKLRSSINSGDFSYEPLENCARTLLPLWSQVAKAYEPKRGAAIICDSEIIGLIGEPTQRLRASLKLPKSVSFFEIDITKLLNSAKKIRYQSLNKYPKINQDITLKTPSKVRYVDLESCLIKSLSAACVSGGVKYELLPLDIFQPTGDSNHLHYSFRINFWHSQKTLTTEEANNLLSAVEQVAKQELYAERL